METPKRHFKFFKFYESWLAALELLPIDDRWMILKAIGRYVYDGSAELIEQLPMTSKVAYTLMVEQADYDKDIYYSIVEKRSKAGRKHKGNQYSKDNSSELEQNGTNGTSVPTLEQMEQMEQMEQDGTINDNYNSNSNDNENKNEKVLSSSISSSFTSQKDKDEIIRKTGDFFFQEGCVSPYSEALNAFKYNEEHGWMPSGKSAETGHRSPIISNHRRIEYLQHWKLRKEITRLCKNDCKAFYKVMQAIEGTVQLDVAMLISGFRGMSGQNSPTITIIHYPTPGYKHFAELIRTDSEFMSKVITTLRGAGAAYAECSELEFKEQLFNL